ncbi:hypothetical protein OCAR_5200 [Afipia carboxidovorans OM5]|nr:hypothetical protein OCAR_5200 [Afipia carboxidovorans OM5]
MAALRQNVGSGKSYRRKTPCIARIMAVAVAAKITPMKLAAIKSVGRPDC